MVALKIYTKIISKSKFYKLDALKRLQKLKFFINDSNYSNAENSAAIEYLLHFPFSLQQYEIKVKAEKNFMAVRQSQNLPPTDLKRAQTEKTVNVPGKTNCSQRIKQKKVSLEVPEMLRGKKMKSWCTTSIPLLEFSHCLNSHSAWGYNLSPNIRTIKETSGPYTATI